ncbi:hypothetical protein P5P86_02695 [Nocardioides sp. BP30]|uniref:hypothetical protein n=1 Tax=Nocardioides sp. BP30 TaxID=3036374 RepID=UPI00246884D2|nr:hypothetical protein [Nocardioides sp. BP30]WGL52741.1 hypothetical protein P5P86_02695 [Nocardioides sp. BP30]
MPTIDLGVARPAQPPTAEVWADLPRRVGLTLTELRLLAELLGAPLPFDVVPPAPEPTGGSLAARLGLNPTATQDQTYAEVLARLGDPADSLRRRGLLAPEGGGGSPRVDPGIAGALGLLAAPTVALDLDVAVDGLLAHAWHRHRAGSVATLATGDGLVFELSWFAAGAWPAELARVAALPGETRIRSSLVPTALQVPWQIADAAAEAVRAGRPELVPVLTGDTALSTVLTALAGEAHGRLRALVSTVPADPHLQPRAIGVAAWTLLADGWHALRPHRAAGPGDTAAGDDLLEILRVEPADLATELAPLLAEVA